MFILSDNQKSVGSVCISPDDSLVASAEINGSVALVWSLESEQVVTSCHGLQKIRGLGFSGDGDILRAEGRHSDMWQSCWKVDDGQYRQHAPSEYEMSELCRGRSLRLERYGTQGKERLVVDGDAWRSALEIFGLDRGEVRRVGPGMVIGPHSHSGRSSLMIRTIGPADAKPAASLPPLDADAGRCWSAAISDDRKYVALGFGNGLVYVHDYTDDREIARWNWGFGTVKALAFSPGRTMIAAGGKQDIAVWSLPDDERLENVERGLLQAVAQDKPNATAVISDYLEERGRLRWDRYAWQTSQPLRMHAQALLCDGSKE